LADVDVSALGPAEDVPLQTGVEDRIARVVLDAGVDDRDHPESLLGKPFEHSARVGEQVRVPGEDPVAVHVLDVQPEHVAGDVVVAVPPPDRLDRVLGVEEPAALVVPE
jgi:hypothetical protein